MKTNYIIFFIFFILSLEIRAQKKKIIEYNNNSKISDAFIETYPFDNYDNRNFSDWNIIPAMAWTARGDKFVIRSLIKFDLKKIKKAKKLKKATLYLYAVDNKYYGKGHSKDFNNDFTILKVISAWDEHNVTWNTQPNISEDDIIFVRGTDEKYKDYQIDITKFVKEWLENPQENYGIMIRLVYEEPYNMVLFGSSDNENPEKRPKLLLEFE